MHRLIKVAALATSLLLLPVSASIFIGRQQPVPYLPGLLRLNDCKPPCWIGIVPGETTVDEARDRIHAVYGSMPGTRLAFDPASPPSLLWVHLGRQDNELGIIGIRLSTHGDQVVDAIAFDFGSIDGPFQVILADMYALYGAPLDVALLDPGVNSPNDLALIYGDEDRGAIVFAPPVRSMPWTQDASLLIFYADHAIPLARSVELKPWHGFSQLIYSGR